jgi:predicted LPLAT superfamily acyltransferase
LSGADRRTAWRAHRERSAPWLVTLIVWIARHGGRQIARLLLWPIAAYFQLTSPAVRRASQEFLARVLERRPRWTDTYRQIFNFSACVLDRVFLLVGRHDLFEIEIAGGAAALNYAGAGASCVMLTAHIGSFDILRVVFKDRRKLRLKVVMDRAQGRMVTEVMARLNPHFDEEIIDAGGGPQLVLRLREALAQGCVIGMMADRVNGDDAGIEVDFLGGRAWLPSGPWKLAAALGLPMVVCFGIYQGRNRYTLHFETLVEARPVSRTERAAHAQAVAQLYARRLEHYARLAPYNWFNFFDFWPDDAARD